MQTAPRSGAPSREHFSPGYQACTLTAVVGGQCLRPSYRRLGGYRSPATARLPRLVARGYPAAVSGLACPWFLSTSMTLLWKDRDVIDSLSESITRDLCRAACGGCQGPGMR